MSAAHSKPNPALIRVPTRVDGRGRDRYEAHETLRERADFDRIVHVGSSNGFHVFRVADGHADPFAHADKIARPDASPTRPRSRR